VTREALRAEAATADAHDAKKAWEKRPYTYDPGKAGTVVTDFTGSGTREGVLFDAADELDTPQQYNPRYVHQGIKLQNGEYRTLKSETLFARCATTGDVFITGATAIRELPGKCPVCGATPGDDE
jgi:hypothetical protein